MLQRCADGQGASFAVAINLRRVGTRSISTIALAQCLTWTIARKKTVLDSMNARERFNGDHDPNFIMESPQAEVMTDQPA